MAQSAGNGSGITIMTVEHGQLSISQVALIEASCEMTKNYVKHRARKLIRVSLRVFLWDGKRSSNILVLGLLDC